MKYGMPYKGSKNKLAGQIFELFPRKKNFYDLFCGGCAMTHYGLLYGGFENFYINDINPACPELFMDAVHGKFKDEKRWISREDFFKLKDSEPYVAFCWSFGNNLRDYLYGKAQDKKQDFDFEKFYSWCEKQTEPLFISSYKMPADRFVCVAMFKHRCTLNCDQNIEVTEKVFIPKHQEKEYHLPGSLFNFDEMM